MSGVLFTKHINQLQSFIICLISKNGCIYQFRISYISVYKIIINYFCTIFILSWYSKKQRNALMTRVITFIPLDIKVCCYARTACTPMLRLSSDNFVIAQSIRLLLMITQRALHCIRSVIRRCIVVARFAPKSPAPRRCPLAETDANKHMDRLFAYFPAR